MTKAKFTGKVISQDIFYDRSGKKVEVPEVCFNMEDYVRYHFHPEGNDTHTRSYITGFEEVEIKKVSDGLYHISFHSVSSPRFEIRTDAFLIIEMTKEQICHWHKNDVWFNEEIGYIIRRAGKKIYGKKDSRRCIKCQYLQRNDATECDRGC